MRSMQRTPCPVVKLREEGQAPGAGAMSELGAQAERVEPSAIPTACPARVRVAILAFDGCLSSAVVGVADGLEIANRWIRQSHAGATDVFQVEVWATARSVRGSGGFLIPATLLGEAAPPDVAIVPPIAGSIAETLRANHALLGWLQAAPRSLLASVCTGAFFLAQAGHLRGRRATTNPAYAELFRRSYPDVDLRPEECLIDEGQVICAGSTSAFLDLGIYLIDRFAGHEIAVLTAKSMCIDMERRSQLPYFMYVAPKDHGDEAVLALQTWMEQHCGKPFTASQLARRAAMGQRTLHRRFRAATGMTPVEYLHRVRVEHAKRLLETSNHAIEQITASVGYADARSFSRLFKAVAGVSPRAYRERFGPLAPPICSRASTDPDLRR